MRKSDKKSRIEFYRAIIGMRRLGECADFFEDILTESEHDTVNQRFIVAKMLIMGMRYSEIRDATGASTATISKVNKALLYGHEGYAKVFDRINK